MSDLDGSALDEGIDAVLAEEPAVAAAYLYGSVVRAEGTPLSDLDLALVTDPESGSVDPGRLLRRLALLLGRRFPGVPVDLRWLGELPAAVAGRVVTEGRLVHEKNPSARLRAEVRARRRYHDFLPIERRGTVEGLAALRQRLADG